MYRRMTDVNIARMMRGLPDAIAIIAGGAQYPEINGSVKFYQTTRGVLVVADIFALPMINRSCKGDVFGFHIHSGSACTGNNEDEFAGAGTHYNPSLCPHPYHAGDMPPIFVAGSSAFLCFITNRFTVDEIIGKTVIIHDKPDDFTTQPSGNSGKKIACGEISAVRR